MSNYSIYCPFDIQKHKETYINYLEVLITEDGEIVYAVPSHQMKAEQLCCQKLNITHEELVAMCPREYWADYLTWLLSICKAISVWDKFYICSKEGMNVKQQMALRKLKMAGLYRGVI